MLFLGGWMPVFVDDPVSAEVAVNVLKKIHLAILNEDAFPFFQDIQFLVKLMLL